MMRAGKSRSAFLSAAMLILALGVVFIGGTLAYTFGESVVYDLNEGEESEKYAVDLQYYNGSGYVSMLEPESAAVFSDSTYWCPGRTEIAYLKLKNNEEFTVNCTLTLEVENSTFGDTLSYAVIKDDLSAKGENHPANWKQFKEKADVSGVLSSNANGTVSHKLLEKQELSFKNANDGEDEYVLAVAIHMDEKATSQYEEAEMKLYFKLQVDANFAAGTTPPLN